MGELRDLASGKDPVIVKGKLKSTFKRVTRCKKLDRAIARKNMKDEGYTQVAKKDANGSSLFSRQWRKFVY